jgi:hypothetical protein
MCEGSMDGWMGGQVGSVRLSSAAADSCGWLG